MAIERNKTSYPGNMSAFWRREVRVLPGGFSLKQTFPVGSLLHHASFVAVDFSDMSAAIVKIAKVLGGTATKPRISKRSNIVPGDTLMKLGKTDKTVVVNKVYTKNPEYDELELNEALTSLTEGDFVQEATAYVPAGTNPTTEAVPAAPKYVANMVLAADLEIKEVGLPTLDVAYDGVVLKSVCTPFPDSWLTENSPCLATNHNILFINQ